MKLSLQKHVSLVSIVCLFSCLICVTWKAKFTIARLITNYLFNFQRKYLQGVLSKNLHMLALLSCKKSCSWYQFEFVFPGEEIISILYNKLSLLNSIICHAFWRTAFTVAWNIAITCFEVVPSSRNSKRLFIVSDDIEYVFVTVLWCWQIYPILNDLELIPWL